MCAINPKHQCHFVLSVYTSLEMPDQEFVKLVSEKAFKAEVELNTDTRLRWHMEVKHG